MTTPFAAPGPEGPGRPTGPPSFDPPSFDTPPSTAGVPPGWYPGPAGGPQWWDGYRWGPPAPPRQDNSAMFAVFAHLGHFVGGFIAPLIILLTEGKKNRFVKHHATEALNFAITVGIASLALVVLYIVGLVVSLAGGVGSRNAGVGAGGFVIVIVLFFVLIFVVAIGSAVLAVIGAVKAGQRRYWRYPLAVRFVRGAASKEEIEALTRRGVV